MGYISLVLCLFLVLKYYLFNIIKKKFLIQKKNKWYSLINFLIFQNLRNTLLIFISFVDCNFLIKILLYC